jgi:hypothetical protein
MKADEGGYLLLDIQLLYLYGKSPWNPLDRSLDEPQRQLEMVVKGKIWSNSNQI